MSAPMKIQGWTQGLYEVSTTKKECLGALRITEDGRKFRYGLSAGTLQAGGVCQCGAGAANHVVQVQTGVTNAAGLYNIKMLVGATAVTANQYDDGYLLLYDDATTANKGYYYPIASHQVSSAGTEIISITLKDPLQKAMLATCTLSLFANPWSAVVAGADEPVSYAGQAFVAMASGDYGWFQTGGWAAHMGEGTAAVGSIVTPSATASETEIAAGYTCPIVGWVHSYVEVAGKMTPIFLTVD